MKPEAFALLKQAESSWWYEARARVAMNVVSLLEKRGTVLDFGCGYGGMQPFLNSYGALDGVEPNQEAAAACRERGYGTVFSSVHEAAVSGKRYELVCAFDSLEHVEDDRALLAGLHPLLQENGALIINVPAYPFLWSRHDVQHDHFRRYTSKSLKQVLEANGYRIVYIGYWNFFLFPLFAASRLLGVGGESSLNQGFAHRIFRFILRQESKFIPSSRLPFGSSVIALAVLR